MGAVIFKQPNGLHGRYSYTSDGFTNINMTKEEYIISKLEWLIKDCEYTFDKESNSYEYVKEDAIKYLDIFDEWIKETRSKKEKERLREEKEKEKSIRENLIKKMETEPVIDTILQEYYKEFSDLIKNLSFRYKDYFYSKKKKYFIENHSEDVKEITKKLKEINKLYKSYGKKRKQNI